MGGSRGSSPEAWPGLSRSGHRWARALAVDHCQVELTCLEKNVDDVVLDLLDLARLQVGNGDTQGIAMLPDVDEGVDRGPDHLIAIVSLFQEDVDCRERVAVGANEGVLEAFLYKLLGQVELLDELQGQVRPKLVLDLCHSRLAVPVVRERIEFQQLGVGFLVELASDSFRPKKIPQKRPFVNDDAGLVSDIGCRNFN